MADRTTQRDPQTTEPGGGRPPNMAPNPDKPISEKEGPERTLSELANDLRSQLRQDQAHRRQQSD